MTKLKKLKKKKNKNKKIEAKALRRTVTVQPCDFLFTSIFKFLFNNIKGDDETPKFLISDVYLKVNKPWDKLHD